MHGARTTRHGSGFRPGPLRVLIVAPFERGLDHGGSQRATAMAERLEERGCVIEWQVVPAHSTSYWEKLRATLSLRPEGVARYPKRAPDASDRLDAAVAAHSYLAHQLASLPGGLVRVIDFHNLEWRHLADIAVFASGPRRAYLRAETLLMRRFERRAIAATDLSVFASRDELSWARSVAAGSDPMFVPSILPRAAERAALALGERGARSPGAELAYVGTVRFPPHLGALREFLRDAWPGIRSAVPEVRLTIAGDCDEEVRRELSSHPGVQALGFVEDVAPLLRRSAAVIMPITGRAGTSMRALYCALAGVWVIGTPAAFRGLSWEMGTIVESPQEWAGAVREAVNRTPSGNARIAGARVAALALQRDPDPWDDLHRRIMQLAHRAARS